MEENEGTQICPNCNREIPKVNFVTHSVHCVRNIKICSVCKEPVLQNELDEHNNKLHMLVPCRQCGEMVRGADMEDHTRDSCAFTLQSCRFCSLEVRRRDVPAHERYCGARTELCAECGEYIMLRYRQLHLDSNHGFIRLRDDSPPRPGMRVVGDNTANRLPADRRPRFPPYVPITNLIRPTVSREESLRLIAQCRAMQREHDHFPRITDEDLRQRIIATVPLLIPCADERIRDDDGTSRLRIRERVIANLRGRTRIRDRTGRDEVEPDVLRQNVAGRNAVAPGAQARNAARVNAVVPNVEAPDAAGENAVMRNVEARDAAGGNAVMPNVEAPDAAGENAVMPNVEARDVAGGNAMVPNVEVRDAAGGNAVMPNVEARDAAGGNVMVASAEAADAVAPNAVAPNAVAPNAVAPNAVVPNAVVPNAVAPNAVAPDGDIQDAVVQDVRRRNAVAEKTIARDAGTRVRAVKETLVDFITPFEGGPGEVIEMPRPRPSTNGTRSNNRVILKRTNDQPQINMDLAVRDKLLKKIAARVALKKRPAPVAPANAPAAGRLSVPPGLAMPVLQALSSLTSLPDPDPQRDLAYYSAMQRRYDEDRRRQKQTAYNLSVGLPPVLDSAAKLEKLRKMDALHNRESDSQDHWRHLENPVRQDNNNVPMNLNMGHSAMTTSNASTVPQTGDTEQQRRQLGNLEPMSAEEFMERFNELQLFKETPASGGGTEDARGRFGDIRWSLRELRRGLNEVTAPYNNSASSNNNNNINKNNNILETCVLNDVLNGDRGPDTIQLDEARALETTGRSQEEDVMVPCEFCCEALRASNIIDHERKCRNELTKTRLAATSTSTITPMPSSRPRSPWDDDNIPVIPCEFCTETLPFYLINEHQALCGRESHLLYPD